MSKTQEELNELKKEYEELKDKLNQLSEDELKQITGGFGISDFQRAYIKCRSNLSYLKETIESHMNIIDRKQDVPRLKKALDELYLTEREVSNVKSIVEFEFCGTHWSMFKQYLRQGHEEEIFNLTQFKEVEDLINPKD